mmetsp:Transcript_29228/g.67079  ORF Transcript_29228/g.67079 Transcript_29228/m.67079 type:complete len:236 (+) Transcript_29228:772-1479(+)
MAKPPARKSRGGGTARNGRGRGGHDRLPTKLLLLSCSRRTHRAAEEVSWVLYRMGHGIHFLVPSHGEHREPLDGLSSHRSADGAGLFDVQQGAPQSLLEGDPRKLGHGSRRRRSVGTDRDKTPGLRRRRRFPSGLADVSLRLSVDVRVYAGAGPALFQRIGSSFSSETAVPTACTRGALCGAFDQFLRHGIETFFKYCRNFSDSTRAVPIGAVCGFRRVAFSVYPIQLSEALPEK